MLSRGLLSKSIAEGTGAFALTFAICGAIRVSALHPVALPPAVIPFVAGLVVACLIYGVGHISGAHFNPAVTIAFAAIRRFPWKEVPFYLVSQFAGAVAAIALLFVLLPDGESFGATVPTVEAWRAVGWEATLTFFLMFVITSVATDSRAVGTLAGGAIGGTIAFCAFIGGPITGASLNPARSFGPALFEGRLDVAWIYFVGPVIGALLGAFLYEVIRCDMHLPKEGEDANGCC